MTLPRNLIEFGQYSAKYNYFYCASPKVACSSILLTLQRLELQEPDFQPDTDYLIHVRDHSPLKSPTAQDVADARLRFGFSRNPFDRLLSCYLEKIDGGSLEGEFQSRLGKSTRVTFADFIGLICDEDEDLMEPHYAPQTLVLRNDLVNYDFIGRFETFSEDIASLSEMLGQDLTPYMARVDAHKTGPKPYEWLTPDLVKKIKRKFSADFDALGYSTKAPTVKQ